VIFGRSSCECGDRAHCSARLQKKHFFVQCDDETNPRDSIDAGQVNVKIGISPVKPAEFVVFSIGQWDGGSSLTE
jgi:hypothetical protein